MGLAPRHLGTLAALVVAVVAACASTSAPAETPTAPTPSATPTAAAPPATVPTIAGVSPECMKAMLAFVQAGRFGGYGPIESCASVEELEAADRALGVGHPDWDADAYDFCSAGGRSAPICATLPGLHEERARALCQRTQPEGIYDVTDPVHPVSEPAASDVGWIQLAAFRDLDGNVSPEPSDLRGEDFYVVPYYRYRDAELVACVVLQAFAFENWRSVTFGTLLQIHASDAIVWVVEVASEERLGAPWRIHPGEEGGRIWHGERDCCDKGLRAPAEADIVAAIEEFLGRD